MTSGSGSEFGPLVEVDWLSHHLRDEDVAVIDVRWKLGAPDDGRSKYLSGHIPTALFLSVDKDLSSAPGTHGGSRPLPNPETLAATLRGLDLNANDRIVVYDDTTGQAAARAWWVLRYIGIAQVAVLNGGVAAWTAAGHPLSAGGADEEQAKAGKGGNIRPAVHDDWTRDIADIRRWVEQRPTETLLVDARAAPGYRGETEPSGGHIPGAVNYPAGETLNNEGRLRSPSDLRRHFHQLADAKEITVYCGSGISSCSNLLALSIAGIGNARLYPGSWSDWSSYPNPPIERGIGPAK